MPKPMIRRHLRRAVSAIALLITLTSLSLGQQQPPAANRPPEALAFANGLLRERRYDLAAKEYERFLETASPGTDAFDARFGLANARLFQGRYQEARAAFEGFLRASPENANAPTAWFRSGETAYMLGDLPGARSALERYTTKYPGHRHLDTAWPYLGDVCLRQNDFPAAIKAYETAIEQFPNGRLIDRSKFGLGRTLALSGQPEPAIKLFNDLADKGAPDLADKSRAEAGKLQMALGQWAEAIQSFEALERSAPRSPLIAESQLSRADAMIKLDRRAEAEPILRQLSEDTNPAIAGPAVYALGTLLRTSKRAVEAAKLLGEAVTKYENTPLRPMLQYGAGEALLSSGQRDQARELMVLAYKAPATDPWGAAALVRAAELTLDSKKSADARTLASSFPELFPQSPLKSDARLIEARAALDLGEPKTAIRLLESIESEKPSMAVKQAASYFLGLAYRADNQPEMAAKVLKDLAKSPSLPAATNAQFLIGQGHVEAGRFPEAVEPLEAYLAENPNGDVADYALAHLAHAQISRDKPVEARKALDRLEKDFPQSKVLATTQLRLAQAAIEAKDYDRAIVLAKRATEAVDPSTQDQAKSALGWAYFSANRPEEAAQAFDELLKASPDSALAPESALIRARALESVGKNDEALAAYAFTAETYAKTPQAKPARLARARLLVETKQPAEAVPIYEAYLLDYPDGGGEGLDSLLAEWGWALVDAGKPTEADKLFTRLLEQFPNSARTADARVNLAETAYNVKNYDEVIRLLSPLVAGSGDVKPVLLQSALYRLGRTQAAQRDWAAAGKTFDRLLSEYGEGAFRREARFWRSEVAFQSGDARIAEVGFATLASEPVGPGDPPGLMLATRRRRIQCLVLLERWKDALLQAEAWKAEAPNDPMVSEVEYARGRALQGLARFEAARAAYDLVIAAKPASELAARAQLMRGESYFHQKDYDEALSEFLKVYILYNAPTWQAAALLQAGKVHEQLAQWAEAAETYQRLASKFPDDPSAIEARKRLEAVRGKSGGLSRREKSDS